MTAKEFRKLGKRDFENGAITSEIWNSLHDRERLIKELEGWLKRAEAYDPHGPNSAGRFGSAGVQMEVNSVIKKLKELLTPTPKPEQVK